MAPLIRWTVGPVSEAGLEILDMAVSQFINIYSHLDLDFCICYNQIGFDKIEHLAKYGVSFYNQHDWESSLPISPKDEIWKIYPPRLRQDSHEIIMDNDLIIFEQIPEINEFLESQRPIILSGCKRFYGIYSEIIPEQYKLNSGLYGFPPGFDFEGIVRVLCELNPNHQWNQDRKRCLYDDQGIIAHAATKDQEPIIVSQKSVFNFNFMMKNIIPIDARGVHFIGANVWQHPAWEKFKKLGYDWLGFKRRYNNRVIL